MNEAGKPDVTAREVLFVLAERAHADGTNSFPSAELISDVTGLDETTIRKAIRRLEDAKLIERDGTRPSGAIVWRLNMSVVREVSHKDARAAKEQARRAAVAERVRRKRAADAAAKAIDVTGAAPVTAVPRVEGVTGAGPDTDDLRRGDVTGPPRGCNGSSALHVTGAAPPEPVKEPPGGIGAAAARPQTPAASNLWLGSVGGSVTAQSDLETCVPHAHGYPRENEPSARPATCAHGKPVEPFPDGTSRCSRCRIGTHGGLRIVRGA